MQIALIKSYAEKPWRSPETYQLIEDSLKRRWPVKSIETENRDVLCRFLARLKRECGEDVFVFNIAEYLDERNKAGFLPALLEEWKTSHLGSSAETIAIGINKATTKDLLNRKGVPTPAYFVANRKDSEFRGAAERIGYPLIVKPVSEGGHIGIGDDSVVTDYAGLDAAVSRVVDAHNQPALVEQYITGKGMREFSVGIVDGEVRLPIPMEIDFESMNLGTDILSYDAAQNDLERIMPVRNDKLRDLIVDLSQRTFDAVGARDYARVDLRMNDSACYVLEINMMPGLGPHSFLPEAAREVHGLEYDRLVQVLTVNSLRRQNTDSQGPVART